jgi:hypothetical protein
MEKDIIFNVYCRKVIKTEYKYTTPTPWKELKELRKEEYRLLDVTRESATLSRIHGVDAPFLEFDGRLETFLGAQKIFQSYHEYYKPWCKWDFSRHDTLQNKDDIQSTLLVWDDLWNDIMNDSDDETDMDSDFNPHKEYRKNNLLQMVKTKIKSILEYALTNEEIEIVTRSSVDGPY